jgi:hypothetical protein
MLLAAQTTQHQIVGWLMNNEWERMWKEAVMAAWDTIPASPESTELKQANFSQNSRHEARTLQIQNKAAGHLTATFDE